MKRRLFRDMPMLSQWSLTFEVRKSVWLWATNPGDPIVAMEPDL